MTITVRSLIKKLLHCLSICVFSLAIIFASGCQSTWKIQDEAVLPKDEVSSDQIAIIEKFNGRPSPLIKTFKHVELGIYKDSGGSRWNTAYAKRRVETPPGIIEIGAVIPGTYFYPEISFTAEAGEKYYITWICTPTGHVPTIHIAVIDAVLSRIVAVDSCCPDCDSLIGAPLLPNTECPRVYMYPTFPDTDCLVDETR